MGLLSGPLKRLNQPPSYGCCEADRRLEEKSRVESLDCFGLVAHLHPHSCDDIRAIALRDWKDHLAEEGPSAVWLVIVNAGPLYRASERTTDLVEMEWAWRRSLRLSISVVTCESVEETLVRIVLQIQGPGAAMHLADGRDRSPPPLSACRRRPGADVLHPEVLTRPRTSLLPVQQRKGAFNSELSHNTRP
jgi:hypothetical protein